jgi:chromosomal replication initiator protein
LAEASQNQSLDVFQDKYRALELLICEDITAIAGRKESQEQLAMTVDEILSSGGRVVITSTRPAGSLERFSRRLVNRFHGGVTAVIDLPEFDSRVLLLNHFATARQIALPKSVAELLADGLPVSPRELLSAVIQLETLARRQKSPITQALAEYYLNQEPMPLPATLSEVAKAVARQFGVPLSGLRGKKRAHGVVLPRQCAMFLARELTDQSLLAIAQFFGRRHHSTVLHACKRMETALHSEPALRQHLAQIRSALGAHAASSCG